MRSLKVKNLKNRSNFELVCMLRMLMYVCFRTSRAHRSKAAPLKIFILQYEPENLQTLLSRAKIKLKNKQILSLRVETVFFIWPSPRYLTKPFDFSQIM